MASFAVALATAVLALVTFNVGANLTDTATERLIATRLQARKLADAVHQRIGIQARIEAALPRLADYRAQLYSGERIRSRWLEVLGGLRGRPETDQLQFEIQSGADDNEIHTYGLRLQVELPHEGLLMTILDELQAAGPRQVQVLGCAIQRRSSAPAPRPEPETGLLAECRIEALSLRDPFALPETPR